MALQFTIRSADLKRLRNALDANPCPEKDKHWIIYLDVKPSIAEFCFGGQRVQYPINGKSTGYAKFPDFAIWEVTRSFLDRKPPVEMDVLVYHGGLRCSDSVSNTEVEVGYVKDPRTGQIHYTNDAELVALGQMLEDPSVLHPEMPRLIKEAGESIAGAVYRAAAGLRQRGVMEDEVEAVVYIEVLVHEKVEALMPALRARFDTLGMNLWKS